jgi:DNA-binding MarR family transcriptional regulator
MSRLSMGSNAGRTRDSVDEHVERAVREFPEIDPMVESIVSRIDILARYLRKGWAEALAQHDLSEGEYKVLVKLGLAGEPYRLSPGELSEHLMVSTGAMTNRIDRVEERDLVVRKPDPHDRRGVLVELTARGKEVLADAVRTQAVNEARLVDVLAVDEQESLSDLLRKLLIHFQDLMGPPPRHREREDA